MGTYTKNLKLETPSYTDNADIPALAKKNNEIIDSEMIKRANGLDYNEQTGVLQLTGNNSKVGSPIQIKNNLPVTSMASGTELKVNNYKQLIKFTKEGKTEQKTYTGKNILDYITKLNPSGNGLTNVINDDGSITTTGKPNLNYTYIINGRDITDELENGETYTLSQTLASNKLYAQIDLRKKDGTYTYLSANLDNRKHISFKVDKTIYENYSLKIQTGTISSWGDSSLTITNKYMLCKGTDTADTSFEPYVGGQSSPNPDYPQQIENISGVENLLEINCDNQNEKGIELINNNDGSVTLNGTSTAKSGAIRLIKNNTSFSVKNLPSEVTFSLSEPLPSGVELAMAYGDENGSWVKNIVILKDNDISKSVKLDIPNNAKYIRFNFTIESGIVLNNITFRPLLEKGNNQHYFVPNGSNYLQLENHSTNFLIYPYIFKSTYTYNGITYVPNNDGSITINGTATSNSWVFLSNDTQDWYLDGSETYEFTVLDKNEASVNGIIPQYWSLKNGQHKGQNGKLTLNYSEDNTTDWNFVIFVYKGTTVSNVTVYPMIRKANIQDTKYEPYKSEFMLIDLKENELCSDKEQTLKDELVIENGRAKIYKKIKEVVLTGNENIVSDSKTSNYYRYKIGTNLGTFLNYPTTLCTHFIYNLSYAADAPHFYILKTGEMLFFSDKSTLDEFKNWLKVQYDAGTPVIIQYELAEPEVIELGKVDFDLIENSTLTCEEESDMQIDYLTISSNIFVQDSLDGSSSQKAPSIDAIKKYFGKKVYDKDANGWIKIEFFDHTEYVTEGQITQIDFSTGWGVSKLLSLPVGMSTIGDRILSGNVRTFDAAISVNISAILTETQITYNWKNNHSSNVTTGLNYSLRILEYV